MADELLTVAEVAGRLGMTDRALRRKLARPEYASQLGVITHRTRTEEGTLPALVYQKIIADKDTEIAYLREQLNLAQQNIARELASRPLLSGPVQQREPFWRRWFRWGQKP